MLTDLKFFIPAIYFDVHKNVMMGRCNWMACQAHSQQGETSMSIVLPLGHMPLQWVCWCDDMAHVGPRQPQGGCSDPSSSPTCDELVPSRSVLTSSICAISINPLGLSVAGLPAPRAALGLLRSPSLAQAAGVSTALDGCPAVALLNSLVRAVAEFFCLPLAGTFPLVL